MGTLEQMPAMRREYRMNLAAKGLLILFGATTTGVALVAAWKFQPHAGSLALPAVLVLIPMSLGLLLLTYAFRSHLIIEGSRITVRGPFTEKSADLSEIEGFRTVSSRNGTYQQIYLKEGRGSITVSSSFRTDDDFKTWFQKIPDLDERDRKALLDEISQQQDLGATPEERLAALKRAKVVGYSLVGVSILLGLALAFGSTLGPSIIRLCTALLALAPFVSGYLRWRSPLLYAAFKNKKDPRVEVSLVPFIAGIAFIFQTSGIHFVTMQPLFFTMIAAFVALLVLYFNSAKSGARGATIGLLAFGGIYSFGLAVVADTVFDNSPPVSYTSSVVGGHVSHGRSTSYYLRLAPWGPVDHEKDVSVSSRIYRNAHVGDTACLTLQSGSLHAPWFHVVPCGDESAPASSFPSDLPR